MILEHLIEKCLTSFLSGPLFIHWTDMERRLIEPVKIYIAVTHVTWKNMTLMHFERNMVTHFHKGAQNRWLTVNKFYFDLTFQVSYKWLCRNFSVSSNAAKRYSVPAVTF